MFVKVKSEGGSGCRLGSTKVKCEKADVDDQERREAIRGQARRRRRSAVLGNVRRRRGGESRKIPRLAGRKTRALRRVPLDDSLERRSRRSPFSGVQRTSGTLVEILALDKVKHCDPVRQSVAITQLQAMSTYHTDLCMFPGAAASDFRPAWPYAIFQ